MSIKIKKKQVALSAMLLALGAAVFINWYYTKPQVKSASDEITTGASQQNENLGDAEYVAATAAQKSKDDFAKFSVERKSAHDSAEESLNKVIKEPIFVAGGGCQGERGSGGAQPRYKARGRP